MGNLLIAKFHHHEDQIRISVWEALALKLAAKAGIPTPHWRLETVGGKSVLVLHRFDRDHERRIPFLSAMSMLGPADGESHSYLEIADAIRQLTPGDSQSNEASVKTPAGQEPMLAVKPCLETPPGRGLTRWAVQ
jgi:hypothetical protein